MKTNRSLYDTIEKYINDGTFLKRANSGKGSHGKEKHGKKSSERLMTRILLGETPKNTTYSNEKDMETYQCEIILDQACMIEKWLKSDSNETYRIDNIPRPGKIIGYGFTYDEKHDSLVMRNTQKQRIILQKDDTVPELGFSIKTAFPDVSDFMECRPIKTDLPKILESTPCYKALSPFEQGYWQYAARFKNFRENTNVSYDINRLSFSFPYEGLRHTLECTAAGVKFTAKDDKGNTTEPHPDFQTGHGVFAMIKKACPTSAEALRYALMETYGLSEEASRNLFFFKADAETPAKTARMELAEAVTKSDGFRNMGKTEKTYWMLHAGSNASVPDWSASYMNGNATLSFTYKGMTQKLVFGDTITLRGPKGIHPDLKDGPCIQYIMREFPEQKFCLTDALNAYYNGDKEKLKKCIGPEMPAEKTPTDYPLPKRNDLAPTATKQAETEMKYLKSPDDPENTLAKPPGT